MEDISCIFCNKSITEVVIKEKGFNGRKCDECGLIYISPRPTMSEVMNSYSENQALTSAEMHISHAFAKRFHAKHNLKIIKKYVKTGSMLEIGAGGGFFLDEAKKEGFEVYGIELNRVAASFIKGKLNIPCEDSALSEQSFCGKKFDVVYHCNVLSHLYDPIAEFRMIRDRLKDGGILVFETGNIAEVKERYFHCFSNFGFPDHLFFFGEDSIRELLGKTGFEIITMERYSILGSLITQQYVKRVRNVIKHIQVIVRLSNKKEPGVALSISEVSSEKAKGAYRTLLNIVTYKIGYLLPKLGRPQTIIVIARKNGNLQ